MDNSLEIIVLQGVPASGKSTIARELVKENRNRVIVSRDAIRESRGEYWIPEQEDYISDIEEFEVRAAINRGLCPIIDATNLNPNTIEKWKNIALELGVKIVFKPIEIDFKTAIERDRGRDRPVGKRVLKSFFSRYFPEKLKEYYTDNRKFIKMDPRKTNCILCDLDGTLAIHCGRDPYDLTNVLKDKPNIPLINILSVLNLNYPIIFISGREGTEQCKRDTFEWISNTFRPNTKSDIGWGWDLKMRKEKDCRSDEIIKEEIYHNEIEPNYNVIAVFDDRDKVVKMWRELGLLCNQVYYGDF